MQQADDYLAEVETLAEVLEPLDEAGFATPTLFKGWSIDDVLGHLHMFDAAALMTLRSREEFTGFFGKIAAQLAQGKTLVETQYPWLDGLRGRALFATWRKTAAEVAQAYAKADPRARVAWGGPDMSTLSCITARQMETWAHGQEVFDALGQVRVESDRIRNICHLGVSTYGWTFINRGLEVPEPAPHVRLTGPSGAVWEWNAPQDDNRVSGDAVAFARVVTQVRSIGDTDLVVRGGAATRWMEMAQCFAGAPEDPPSPGARHVAVARP
jgi:uncharacterized protein (TIGR03084 family)